jgi:hypothetical protein
MSSSLFLRYYKNLSYYFTSFSLEKSASVEICFIVSTFKLSGTSPKQIKQKTKIEKFNRKLNSNRIKYKYISGDLRNPCLRCTLSTKKEDQYMVLYYLLVRQMERIKYNARTGEGQGASNHTSNRKTI